MKYFFIFFLVVIGGVFSFILVEDFKRNDDVQTVQSERQGARSNPVSDSTELKHASEVETAAGDVLDSETISAAEAQSAQSKPVEGATPANAFSKEKSIEDDALTDRLTDRQNGDEIATDLKPAAIPVVTAEEATKLNTFAFLLSTVKTTVVEGEITERSELPDPEKSDYPNCRFTAHFTGNSIKSGEPCPKEMAFIIEGFENYRILQENDIKAKDKVLCTIAPFSELPEDLQSIQQADDLELYLLESYYVLDIKKIMKYSDKVVTMPVSGIYFSDGNEDYISLFERHINPPLPDYINVEQSIRVQNDYETMKSLLDGMDDERINEINKRFSEAWEKEKAKDPPDYNRVGDYVWRNMDNSFWTLPASASEIVSKPDTISREMLDSFLSLKQVLAANGVHLIVSLVPQMNDISARVINREFMSVPDIQTATYVKQLSETGVETIYASDQIIKNYNKYPFAFFIPENPHPSDTTQDVISDLLADRIKRYEIKPVLDPALFSEEQVPHVYEERKLYLFPNNCDIGDNQAGKSYLCRDVFYNGERNKKDKDSPVLVVGNSYIQTPMGAPDSLPTLLSFKLRSPVFWYRIEAYGPFSEILFQLLQKPEYFLKDKKVFILQFGTQHLTDVNRAGTMLNLAELDSERVLLNGKKLKGHIPLSSNANAEQKTNQMLWGPLSEVKKSVLTIDESGELTYHFKLEENAKGITDSASIAFIVPHTGVPMRYSPDGPGTACKLTINSISKAMHVPTYASSQKFFNLAYELPAGTKEITVKIEGNPGTLVAIKDIQIWQ